MLYCMLAMSALKFCHRIVETLICILPAADWRHLSGGSKDGLFSRRILKTNHPCLSLRVGIRFINEIAVPAGDPAYHNGARLKRRYLWEP